MTVRKQDAQTWPYSCLADLYLPAQLGRHPAEENSLQCPTAFQSTSSLLPARDIIGPLLLSPRHAGTRRPSGVSELGARQIARKDASPPRS